MKRILALGMALFVVAALPVAAQVSGSAHDMRAYVADETTTQVCVFCHTPHQATTAASQDPLWNHTLSSNASYGVYASDTLNAAPTDIGGAAAGSANVSQLCMSCHDGTVGVNSLYKAPLDGSAGTSTLISGTPLVGTDLTNDHPVNFTYDAALATADGGLTTPASADFVDADPGGVVPLFSGTLQCGSCHDPHDDANGPFLVMSNTDSALCSTCHTK